MLAGDGDMMGAGDGTSPLRFAAALPDNSRKGVVSVNAFLVYGLHFER